MQKTEQIDNLQIVLSAAVVDSSGTNTYTWTGNGRLFASLTSANGTTTEYGYDSLNRLTNLLHQASTVGVISSFAYQYNNADQRTQVTREDGRAIDYTYDSIGQLTAAHGSRPGYNFEYNYDPVGNPLKQDRNGYVMTNAFNNLNQNTTGGWSGSVTVLGTLNIRPEGACSALSPNSCTTH